MDVETSATFKAESYSRVERYIRGERCIRAERAQADAKRGQHSLSQGPDGVDVAVGGVGDAGAAVEDARDAFL